MGDLKSPDLTASLLGQSPIKRGRKSDYKALLRLQISDLLFRLFVVLECLSLHFVCFLFLSFGTQFLFSIWANIINKISRLQPHQRHEEPWKPTRGTGTVLYAPDRKSIYFSEIESFIFPRISLMFAFSPLTIQSTSSVITSKSRLISGFTYCSLPILWL